MTQGFPEEVTAEPRHGKEDERKKRSVAAEYEAQKQESSPTVKELRKVQCGWVTAWEDLKKSQRWSRKRASHRPPTC